MGVTPSQLRIRVNTLNVMAEVFFRPEEYDKYLFDKAASSYARRNPVLIGTVMALAGDSDIMCLQEVEADRAALFEAALGADFYTFFVPHTPDRDARLYDAAHPYTPNGNMTFIRKTFTYGDAPAFDVLACPSGSRFPVADFVLPNQNRVRVVNVHLAYGAEKKKELQQVFDELVTADLGGIQFPLIICGDFNADITAGGYKKLITDSTLKDVMKELEAYYGTDFDKPTTPAYGNQGGEAQDRCLLSLHFGAENTSYIQETSVSTTTGLRLDSCLVQIGSDHFIGRFVLVM